MPKPNRRSPNHSPRAGMPQRTAARSDRAAPSRAVPQQSPATHWGDVADWYDQLVGDEGSDYHQHVVLPGVLRLLNVAPGQRILDLACGQGVLCRVLAKEGAVVTGIDAAADLIAAAQKRASIDRLNITYRTGDARALAEDAALPPASFDAATVILAIQNITPLSPVWQGLRRVVKPGGHVVVVMMHPCFRVPRTSTWRWDDVNHNQQRTITTYLTSSKVDIQMHPGRDPGAVTATFHRPLQAYINTMGSAGLLIDHIDEWPSHKKSQPGPKQKALDQSRKEIPMFLAIRALVR
jgi:2-polyprenyl-3-methyl-5-hydroxy-6-metoxy-1,4-benzoquinol methylase